MTDQSITRIDDITLLPGRRDRFKERLLSEYVPWAASLGLGRVEVAYSPPVDLPDRETDVVLTWRLPDVDAFWGVRAAAMMNPGAASFWETTASLVTRRTRRYACASSQVTPLDD